MSQCLSWCTKCTVCIVYIIINVAPPKFGLPCFFLVCLLENKKIIKGTNCLNLISRFFVIRKVRIMFISKSCD